jgi:hypothetical protein
MEKLAMAINAQSLGISRVETLIGDYLCRHVTKDVFRSNRENIKAMYAWFPEKEETLLSSQEAFWLKKNFPSRKDRFEAYKESMCT